MASTNRTGRVSAINYKAGTYEVTYFDRGKSVTREINAQSNGEYMMPAVGQIVSVSHNSNGTATATTTGTVWNKTNAPAEGYAGLYRKEYSNKKGQAYDRYDANTGVYTQYVDKRTGRNCNGEIYDEAKGPISLIAGGQLQLISSGSSASIQAKTGMGIAAGKAMSMEAGTSISIEAESDMGESVGGKRTLEVSGESEEAYKGTVERTYEDDIKDTISGNVESEITGDVTINITGDVTLEINGATITVSAGGDVGIVSPTKIDFSAPEVNISGDSGEVKIGEIKLTKHRHTGTQEPIV